MSEYVSYNYKYDNEETIRAQEQAKREEMQRRRELELRQDICGRNEEELRALKEHFSRLSKGASASFIQSASIDAISEEISMIESRNNTDASSGDLQKITIGIHSIHNRLSGLEKDSQSKYRTYLDQVEQEDKRKAISLELMNLTTQTTELRKQDSNNFMRGEMVYLQNLLMRCSKLLIGGKYDDALTSLGTVQSTYEKMCTLFASRVSAFNKLEELVSTVNYYLRNPVYKVWIGKLLEGFLHEIRTLQKRLSSGSVIKVSDIEKKLLEISHMVSLAVADADKKQEDEIIRKNVLDTLLKTLREEGFSVSPPKLESGQNSDVVLLATKPGRARPQSIHVKLGLAGRVVMDVDGGDPGDIARIQETQIDRSRESNVVCNRIANGLKELLENKGVKLTNKSTVWHAPDRIARTAKHLPGGLLMRKKLN